MVVGRTLRSNVTGLLCVGDDVSTPTVRLDSCGIVIAIATSDDSEAPACRLAAPPRLRACAIGVDDKCIRG
jgi:hypothetical protein